jgi:hypothetical protein
VASVLAPSSRLALILDRAGPVAVARRSDQWDAANTHRLLKSVRSKEWTCIAPGAYARTTQWESLAPIERHRVRVLEVARRLRAPAVLSHFSAAAAWGIDVLGSWPKLVDVAYPASSGGRSSGVVRRHTIGLEDLEVVPFGRHVVTSPAQTVLDLARHLPFVRGVSAVDQAIWGDRDEGPLTSREEIAQRAETGLRRRGDVRARRVIGFARDQAANVRESQSRVVLMQLGFPEPRLQERRILPSGRLVFGDFYFPTHDHWGELDGRGKYRSPAFGSDRDAADIVIDEKNRENEIRREVRGFSRWEPADVDVPSRLYDILTRDGLPSVLSRP